MHTSACASWNFTVLEAFSCSGRCEDHRLADGSVGCPLDRAARGAEPCLVARPAFTPCQSTLKTFQWCLYLVPSGSPGVMSGATANGRSSPKILIRAKTPEPTTLPLGERLSTP